MTYSEYIGKCVTEMMQSGVTMHFNSEDYRTEDYSYFFTNRKNKNPFFCINYKYKDYIYNFEIFIHEYCHFLQWKMKSKIYKKSFNPFANFEKWLMYKIRNFSIEDLRIIQQLEIDCDRRAINQIEKYNLPVNKIIYTQKSNSYILSYNYMFTDRIFFKNLDFENEELIRLMPTVQLTMSQIKKGFPEHEKLFRKIIK